MQRHVLLSALAVNLVLGGGAAICRAAEEPPPRPIFETLEQAVAGTQYRIVVDGLICDDGPPVCWHPTQGNFTLAWQPVP